VVPEALEDRVVVDPAALVAPEVPGDQAAPEEDRVDPVETGDPTVSDFLNPFFICLILIAQLSTRI